MRLNCTGWIFVLPLLFVSCSTPKQISRLAKNEILTSEAFTSAHIGISIYEPATQKYWYNFQGDKYFVPASNTKLPTCYAAMKYLGDSVVGLQHHRSADTLFISAWGDPTFLHPDFTDQRIYEFLKTTGDIIILNTSSWREKRWGIGWAWDDYNEDYMAERSAFPIYGNLVRFTNKLKNIQVSPPYFSTKIIRDSIQKPDAVLTPVHREIASNAFYITAPDSLPGVFEMPFYTGEDSTILNLLKDTLHKQVYQNYSRDDKRTSYKNAYSEPTDSLLKIMMHRSDNFFAEQSLLMVSRQLLDVMNDEKIIDTLLKTDFKDLPQRPVWVDGSGLSRYNLFTPKDFVGILKKMKDEFGIERMKHILPTGGAGTLTNYYKTGKGYIFAKTGTLSGVIALSGLLYTKKNKLLIFSVLVNNHHSDPPVIRRAIEKFIEALRNNN